MTMPVSLLVALLMLVLPASSLDPSHFAELNKKAKELRKQQDWVSLRKVLTELRMELPAASPLYMLRMASVETHLQHRTEALRWLERYAATGLSYNVSQDEDLKPLMNEPGFQKVAEQMKERTKPIQNAEFVCMFPKPDMMPEDIALQKVSSTFVVSSVKHHTLFQISLPKHGERECGIKEFPLEQPLRRWPTMAVSTDVKRNLLWFTASALPGFEGFPEADAGKSEVVAVTATNGDLVRRFDVGERGAVLGDMLVAQDGTVYVTDTAGGGVYRIRGDLDTAKLEKIAAGLISPQTPVLARDGKRLFAPDYPIGIAVVDLTRPQAKLDYLPSAKGIALTGLDGLYRDGNSLVGIQNGTTPQRIIRFRMNAGQTSVISAEVIEQAKERLGEPTHAVPMKGMFYVCANVGWDKLDSHGQLKAGEHFTPPLLLRFREEHFRRKTHPRVGLSH